MSRMSYLALRKIAADDTLTERLKAVDPRVWSSLGGTGLGWLTAAALGGDWKKQLLGAALGGAAGFGGGQMYTMYKDMQEQKEKQRKIDNSVAMLQAVGKNLQKGVGEVMKGSETEKTLKQGKELYEKGKVIKEDIDKAVAGDPEAAKRVVTMINNEVGPHAEQLARIAREHADAAVIKAKEKGKEGVNALDNFILSTKGKLKAVGNKASNWISEKINPTPKDMDPEMLKLFMSGKVPESRINFGIPSIEDFARANYPERFADPNTLYGVGDRRRDYDF